MKEFVFIAILFGAIILFTILYVKNRNKIKKFERTLSNDVVKTRFNISNRSLYIDKDNSLTIVLNAVPWRVDRLEDFVYESTLKAGKTTFLFDRNRNKCAIFNDKVKQNQIRIRLFDQFKSIGLFEEAKTKTVTRGGISPIAIHGYRVASVKKRRETKISRIYYVLTYIADGKEWKQELDLYNGLLDPNSSSYASKLREAEIFMKEFSRYTGCKVGS